MVSFNAIPAELHGLLATYLGWEDIQAICRTSKIMRKCYQEHLFTHIRDCSCRGSKDSKCTCLAGGTKGVTPLRNSTRLLEFLIENSEVRTKVQSIRVFPGFPPTKCKTSPIGSPYYSDKKAQHITQTLNTTMEKFEGLTNPDKQKWIDGMIGGDTEAQYAAIVGLSRNVRELHIDVKYLTDGSYFEILGRLASTHLENNRSKVLPFLSDFTMDCLRGQIDYNNLSTTHLGWRLLPWATLPNVENMILCGIMLHMPGALENDTNIIFSSKTALNIRSASVSRIIYLEEWLTHTATNWSIPYQRGLFRSLGEYLQLSSGIRSLRLHVPSLDSFTGLQSTLNCIKDSLVNIDLVGSSCRDWEHVTGLQSLSFEDFRSLETLRVQFQAVCPNIDISMDPTGRDAFRPIPRKFPQSLRKLTINVPSYHLRWIAGLAKAILHSSSTPMLEKTNFAIDGYPHQHHNIDLDDYLHHSDDSEDVENNLGNLWRCVGSMIYMNLWRHLPSVMMECRYLAPRHNEGVRLRIALTTVLVERGSKELVPHLNLRYWKDDDAEIVESFLDALMESYISAYEEQA